VDFILAQALTGLAEASSLFLVASGLSIIFGVTRIVNFAHGAFYMIGAYAAYTLTERWAASGALGFWGGLLAAAAAVAVLGALIEIVLLRRIYRAPDLFQLLATFGLTLMAEDLSLLVWGGEDLVGPRAPGLHGAVVLFGQLVPSYDLVLIGLGPAVLLWLWLLLHHTRFGILVRAATQDREMVAALGVNQRWLFTGVFALGAFLAAFGGALQIPRDAVSHTMDLRIIVECFVVVVIGGLGSIGGAFVASVLVAELNAFGILVLPGVSLVLVFAVMAVVLVLRPYGLFGRASAIVRGAVAASDVTWRPFGPSARLAVLLLLVAAALLPLRLGGYSLSVGGHAVSLPDYGSPIGNYGLAVGAEILIFALFAASLQLLMSVGGLVSFGHAAYFGLGAYGAALAVKMLGLGMPEAIGLGVALGLAGAAIFGWFCIRLSGVYFAMLTLALAQIAWSIAFAWTAVTGGDNGLIGIWPAGWAATPRAFYWLTLGIAASGIGLLRMIAFSPFGYALRAVRDSPQRAETIGLGRRTMQWTAFVVAGGFAALAGALFAFLKGSVFPDALGLSVSVDGLVMVLLGGIGTVSGGVAGAVVYKAASIWLISHTDYSKLVLGAAIVLLVVLFPEGIGGFANRLARRGHSRAVAAMPTPSESLP
jgi:branched-chain amino acid transport system permease protein